MDQIRFRSIRDANLRYAWTKASSDGPNNDFYRNPGRYVGSNAYQYETYGDGEVQHSPMHLVSADSLEDFICSLALFLAENQNKEVYECLRYNQYLSNIDKDQVMFLYNLKIKEKTVYIDLSEQKKSTDERKQYDKRWMKIADDYRPTFENIFPFFCQSYHGLMDRLAIAERIREITNYDLWVSFESYFHIPKMDHIRGAMKVIECFLSAFNSLDNLNRNVESLKHNMELDKNDPA